MKINIYQLLTLMTDILLSRGLNQDEAELVAHDYWEAELGGKTTHGVSKFLQALPYITERVGRPEIIVDKGGIVSVNGNREVGQLAASFCTNLVIERAKTHGIAIVSITNIQRYGVLASWVKKIAEHNFVGILVTTCEPAAAAYNATTPVLGSNPIAVGIPTTHEPIVLDMATTQVSMSSIWKALLEKQSLPKDLFFDENGDYTTDPQKAKAAEVFGGYKGFGLSLAIEILAGSLIMGKMGKKIQSPYDIGSYFQAIDPSVWQDKKAFTKANTVLINEIKRSKKKVATDTLLIPGERSVIRKHLAMKHESLFIAPKLWEALQKAVEYYETE